MGDAKMEDEHPTPPAGVPAYRRDRLPYVLLFLSVLLAVFCLHLALSIHRLRRDVDESLRHVAMLQEGRDELSVKVERLEDNLPRVAEQSAADLRVAIEELGERLSALEKPIKQMAEVDLRTAREQIDERIAALEEAAEEAEWRRFKEEYFAPISDDDNAATDYGRALALLDEHGDKDRIAKLLDAEKVGEEVAAVLKRNADVLETIKQGIRKEKCRFPWDVDAGFGALLPHLAQSRAAARLLALEAKSKWAAKDVEGAVKACLIGIRYGQHVGGDGTIIARLVGLAIEQMMVDPLERYVKESQQEPAFYVRVIEALDKLEGVAASPSFPLEVEKGIALRTMGQMIRGQVPVELDDMGNLTPEQIRKGKGEYVKLMSQLIEAANKPYWEAHPIIKMTAAEAEGAGPMVRMLLPALERYVAQCATCKARLRAIKVIAALQAWRVANKSFPDSLEALGQ